MKPIRSMIANTSVYLALFAAVLLTACSGLYAADTGPLSRKGTSQCGINLGYGYSFESNKDIRFASVYPYFGTVLTDPVGSGWYRGTFEGIIEGAFTFVHKHQKTYAAGVNILGRYNFIAGIDCWRPYVQAGLGAVCTNLGMHDFGSNFNFTTNVSFGLQYFINPDDAVSFEWRFIHMSNAGLDGDNAGLNMNNFFIGYAHTF